MYTDFAADWSGTPDAPIYEKVRGLYAPCGLCVSSMETVDQQFMIWRKEFGFSIDQEFHGHGLRKRPEILETVVRYALEQAKVVAYLFDKHVLIRDLGSYIFDKPKLLVPATGLLVFNKMLETAPIQRALFDEDIAADRRKAFNTQARQEVWKRWPEIAMKPGFPKHLPSHKANLIQFVDMIAYVLQREANNLSETAELQRLVKALWQKEGNYICWGSGSDLQPYL